MFNLTGTTLGRYHITERLGRGGMADVYKAAHTRLGTPAAVKVLYSHLVDQEDFLMRFEREAKAVAGLRHPNIVRVFDYDIENELSYIVMDYIDGGTLKESILAAAQRGEFLPFPELLHILRQVGSALDYAHRQGMIHRDVKSANILLDRSGNAFLTDFGIAHIVSSTHITSTGSLIGTPVYMSPEQCQGLKATPASDIYSLGMVVFEMLTGVVPFASDTPLAVIHKHLYEDLPLPGKYRPDLPAELQAAVMRALAREPQNRYETAGAFLDGLAAAMLPEFAPPTIALQTREEERTAALEPVPQVEINPQDTVADLSPQDFLEPPDFDSVPLVEARAVPPATQAMQDAGAVLPTILDGEEDMTVAAAEPDVQETPEHAAQTVVREPEPAPQMGKVKPQQEQQPKKKVKRGVILAIAGGAIIVILLALALLSGVFEGGGVNDPTLCNSPHDCLQTAWLFKEQGKVDLVKNALVRMEKLIPPGDLPKHAFRFCEGGEIYLYLEMPRLARDYFIRCLENAGEDEDLRRYAQDLLDRIE